MTDRDDLVAEVRASREVTPTTDPVGRAIAATEERGQVVVECWCDICGDGVDPIAIVRRFSRGFVFDGRGTVEMDPARETELLEGFRARGSGRIPFVVQARAKIIITEAREPDTDWPPRADCPMHGSVSFIDPNLLLRLARSAKPGRPQKLILHPEGSTA